MCVRVCACVCVCVRRRVTRWRKLPSSWNCDSSGSASSYTAPTLTSKPGCPVQAWLPMMLGLQLRQSPRQQPLSLMLRQAPAQAQALALVLVLVLVLVLAQALVRLLVRPLPPRRHLHPGPRRGAPRSPLLYRQGVATRLCLQDLWMTMRAAAPRPCLGLTNASSGIAGCRSRSTRPVISGRPLTSEVCV